MTKMFRSAAALAGCLVLGAADARSERLLGEERLCDRSAQLCLRGTLDHDEPSNVLRFRGRVAQRSEPGTARFFLSGVTPGGQSVTFEFIVEVDGRYSEILDVARVPDAPTGTRWTFVQLTFTPRG